MRTRLWLGGATLVLGLLVGCRQEQAGTPQAEEHATPGTNRIDVPEPVRQNLGITFAVVDRRRVAATVRFAGQFELLPSGRREYRMPWSGRVELAVEPLQQVAAGDLLCRLDSPDWRSVQRELGELSASIAIARGRLAAIVDLLRAHRAHEEGLQGANRVLRERVDTLERLAAGGGLAAELSAARVALAQGEASLSEAMEKEAETQARQAELEVSLAASLDRFDLVLSSAASVLGVERSQLLAETGSGGAAAPAWRVLGLIDVRATAAGVVDTTPIASGAWVGVGDLLVTTVDPERLRFRARGLQSDLGRIRAGLPARIVPPRLGSTAAPTAAGRLEVGVEADPLQRTVDLFLRPGVLPAWARPGVAAFLEVETESGAPDELAIPLSTVLQDGLERVLFRRDPRNPDVVIRLVADLGVDDGRWVEVLSGLREGDQVVLDGAYELMLATSGSVPKGGHFHADGTWHADGK